MTLPALNFECYQMESGVWCKRRPDGRRGACVADEAILWQHLQAALAALGGKPPPGVDIKELVRENERLSKECERLGATYRVVAAENARFLAEMQATRLRCGQLAEENTTLRANQRRKPGRKPRSGAAGAEEKALAAPEQDPLDEDL